MKKPLGVLVAAVFVLMAALLGWFLPLAVFNVDDTLAEGKEMDLEIARINLSYRDDLSIAEKIKLVNNNDIYDSMELDKGIFNSEDDLKQIISDFLADFTGYRFDFWEANFAATPFLVNLPYNKGTIVLWGAVCWLDDGWYFDFAIDDKTGAILRCDISGNYDTSWGALVSDYSSIQYNPYSAMIEKYRNAIYNHYSKRIGAKFITYHQVQEWTDEDMMGYRMIFRDDKNDTFEITVNISLTGQYIQAF